MKITALLAVTIIIVGFLTSEKSANAATIQNFSGTFIDMTPGTTTLAYDQSGQITSTGSSVNILSVIGGSLPSNSMIEFSYSFSSPLTTSVLSTTANGAGEWASATSAGDGSSFSTDSTLIFSSAGLDLLTNTGTAIIKNFSAGVLDFMSSFSGMIAPEEIGDITITYNVSAVPIPAALPMFGLGLAALVGYRRKKAKKAQS